MLEVATKTMDNPVSEQCMPVVLMCGQEVVIGTNQLDMPGLGSL